MAPLPASAERDQPSSASRCTLREHTLRCGHILSTAKATKCLPICDQPGTFTPTNLTWPTVCKACRHRSDREFLLKYGHYALPGSGFTLEYDACHPWIDYDPLLGDFREEVLVRVRKTTAAPREGRNRLRKAAPTTTNTTASSTTTRTTTATITITITTTTSITPTAIVGETTAAGHSKKTRSMEKTASLVLAEHWLQAETWLFIRDNPGLASFRMALRELCPLPLPPPRLEAQPPLPPPSLPPPSCYGEEILLESLPPFSGLIEPQLSVPGLGDLPLFAAQTHEVFRGAERSLALSAVRAVRRVKAKLGLAERVWKRQGDGRVKGLTRRIFRWDLDEL